MINKKLIPTLVISALLLSSVKGVISLEVSETVGPAPAGRIHLLGSEISDRDLNFAPQKEWSIKYINIFKQALKEKYELTDENLNKLRATSVIKGVDSDGFAVPFTIEKFGAINYVYFFADWAPYQGRVRFDVKDEAGKDLSEEQIAEQIKTNLIPIFSIKIIAKETLRELCGEAVRQELDYQETAEKVVLKCWKELDIGQNKCTLDIYSFEDGKPLESRPYGCIVSGDKDTKNPFTPTAIATGIPSETPKITAAATDEQPNAQVAIIIVVTVILLVAAGIFLTVRKAI